MLTNPISKTSLETLLFSAGQAAYCGGLETLSIYHQPFSKIKVETKPDNSPVTLADKNSSLAIVNYLSQRTPSLPIISEEENLPPFQVRQHWSHFWIVDPLDGTNEFIQKSKHFGVMVSLIENRKPLLGAIFFPLDDCLYLGAKGIGGYKLEQVSTVFKQKSVSLATLLTLATKLPLKRFLPTYTILQSKSHLSAADLHYLNTLKTQKKTTCIRVGSCLKFAYLVEGRANEYSRFGEVHEWDVAAGQAIIESAGGLFTSIDGKPLIYNSPKLLIDNFKAVI